jgi:cyclic-di-AMP phosphodiesterase PgpH
MSEEPSTGKRLLKAVTKTEKPNSAHTKVTRKSRTSRGRRFVERLAQLWGGLLEKPLVWLAVFVVAGSWVLLPAGSVFAPSAGEGKIATRDIVAPRDAHVLDEESTNAAERRAREEVLPVYDFASAAAIERQEALGRLFAEGRRLTSAPEEGPPGPPLSEGLAARLEQQSGVRLNDESARLLVGRRFSPELEDRLKTLTRQLLTRGIVANKSLLLENHRNRGILRRDLATREEVRDLDLYGYLGYPAEVQEVLETEVLDWGGWTGAERRALVDLLTLNLQPNLSLNQSETLERKEQAASRVDRTFTQVHKGQTVVRRGDQITALQARLVEQLYGRRNLGRLAGPVLAGMLLMLLVAGALWGVLGREELAGHSSHRLFSEGLILLLGSLLAAKLAVLTANTLPDAFNSPVLRSSTSYLWAVPWAAVGLVAALLARRNVAIVVSLLAGVLAARLAPGSAFDLVVYTIGGSLAAIFALEYFELKQRLSLAKVGLMVAVVNVLIIVLLAGFGNGVEPSAGQVGFDMLMGVVSGMLATAVASFVLPILESLFGITTEIKLIELANTNLPLLRRLAFEAPGTFQHSIMVANLAKQGCEAIGADVVLAYTGALYHDIGKVFRPQYFIENQHRGMNPHDALQPSMSALVVINHVKEGLELAKRHHLPLPILEAIEQHHGNRLITFFYRRAQEQAGPDVEVREEKYRYPGPRPQNRVMGVLMLADGVEAASRTLSEPTPTKIRTLIDKIFDDCLQDGQLDEADLTLSDFKKVSEAFFRVLTNLYHQRIDYPGFDFNTPRASATSDKTGDPAAAQAS